VGVDTILGKVLLVTDDSEGGQFWADALRRHGVEIVVVGSAGDPLAQWEQDGFDLILVDVSAQADGPDLCRRLRGRAVNPILLLCPCEDETCVLEVYRAGADECILKPVSPATLLAKVGAWLRHRWTVRVEALNPVEGGGIRTEPDPPPAAHPPDGAR
jgi:DNA-binding response OmpR family regulator